MTQQPPTPELIIIIPGKLENQQFNKILLDDNEINISEFLKKELLSPMEIHLALNKCIDDPIRRRLLISDKRSLLEHYLLLREVILMQPNQNDDIVRNIYYFVYRQYMEINIFLETLNVRPKLDKWRELTINRYELFEVGADIWFRNQISKRLEKVLEAIEMPILRPRLSSRIGGGNVLRIACEAFPCVYFISYAGYIIGRAIENDIRRLTPQDTQLIKMFEGKIAPDNIAYKLLPLR